MRMRRLFFTVICSAVVLGTCGCASTRQSATIEVSLVDLRLGTSTLFETAGTCVLRVQNLGGESIQIDGSSHRLELNGRRLGTGLSQETVEIPRLSERTIDIQLRLRNLNLARLLADLRKQPTIEFNLESTFYTRGRRNRSIRLVEKGSLNLASQAGVGARLTPRNPTR